MKHKDQILKLRKEGYTYDEIQVKLGCSKGTIAYHCGVGQKTKNQNRQKNHRSQRHPLITKIENFSLSKNYKTKQNSLLSLSRLLYKKVHRFQEDKMKTTYNSPLFTVENLLEKIGDNPKCALTNKSIDLSDTKSYELDHIVPRSKGGDNSLDNCQILCKEVNQAKRDMSQEDFIKLCHEVAKNNPL